MKLNVAADLSYEFAPQTELIVSVQAAHSADQIVLSEKLVLDPPAQIIQDLPDERGERRFRTRVDGPTKISYSAIVDNGARQALSASAQKLAWTQLPQDALQYLTPSRYCPSDKFDRFAQREFGDLQTGGAQALAVADWIFNHIDYVPGVSTSETTAERTFLDRAGVCRDFSHLGISMCRALNIPARAVSAYALALDPPDFHAVFEVYLDGAWWLLDPTRLAAIDGMVRVGIGRDAGDIAFLTSSLPCISLEQLVIVSKAAVERAA